MRIPTIALALLAAALSGSAGARPMPPAKSPEAAAPAARGPADLAARDRADGLFGARADMQKRQVNAPDPSEVIKTVDDDLNEFEVINQGVPGPLDNPPPPEGSGSGSDSGIRTA